MMTKTIVVYGCDNSGKTTACQNLEGMLLERGYRVKVIHSPGPASAVEMIQFMAENTSDDPNIDIRILDRFPAIEELVYGPLIRGENKLMNFHNLCNLFMDRIDRFIYCDPGISTIENWGNREQMDGVKENAKLIRYSYVSLVYEYTALIKASLYNWKKSGTDGLRKLISDLL